MSSVQEAIHASKHSAFLMWDRGFCSTGTGTLKVPLLEVFKEMGRYVVKGHVAVCCGGVWFVRGHVTVSGSMPR